MSEQAESDNRDDKRAASTPQRPLITERLSVALIAEASAAMDKLQDRTRLKKVDIVNRALVLYEFIENELRTGNRLLSVDPDGREQLIKIL